MSGALAENQAQARILRDTVRDFARQNGCIAGVCPAIEPPAAREILEGKNSQTPFVSRNMEKRLDPGAHLRGAASVAVLGRFYGAEPLRNGIQPVGCDALGAPGSRAPQKRGGLMTAMARGEDYHAALRSLLEELARVLREKAAFRYAVKVDGAGLLEREYAKMAGLGFQGKNCCVISPGKGSFFSIGLLITDIEIAPTRRGGVRPPAAERICGDCGLCVRACPSGAIAPGGYEVDAMRCVSYLTQKDGELSAWEKEVMGPWVYGCDACQTACPHNAGAGYEPVRLDLERLLAMGDDEFDGVFAGTCAAWRGREILRRNAENAARNAEIGGNVNELREKRR